MNHELWTTEAWYTMNSIPKDDRGQVLSAPIAADNTLTKAEQDAGWKLLFDGTSTKGWKNYGKETIGSDWIVENGALTLNAKQVDGKWSTSDGGDIVTLEEYENYELSLDWKVGACGNSGIMFNVTDNGSKDYPWQTGPEMQILDNVCHPDGQIITHRAGDLYDMISCKFETVKPAGEWNTARIVIHDGHLEQWLNGRKLVETEMFTPEWATMIAESKFKDMDGFGQSRKGRISLQDHNDPISFKNIKIRELNEPL